MFSKNYTSISQRTSIFKFSFALSKPLFLKASAKINEIFKPARKILNFIF
jgi:hypothetical protein